MALTNLFGDLGLDATLQKIAGYLSQLANTIGRVYPDTGGNLRVSVSSGTITGINSAGGYNMQYDQYAQIQTTVTPLRAQIKIS